MADIYALLGSAAGMLFIIYWIYRWLTPSSEHPNQLPPEDE